MRFVAKHDTLYVADETATIPGRNPKLSPGIHIATLDGKITANVPYRQGNALEAVTVDAAGISMAPTPTIRGQFAG